MPQHYRHQRSANPATAFPATVEPGEIIVNTANRQIAVGDAASGLLGVPLSLLAVRIFDPRAQYAAGEFIIRTGELYRANAAVTPGVFNPAQWTQYVDKTYVDNAVSSGGGVPASTVAFVPVGSVSSTDVQAAIGEVDSEKVAKVGDTMTGHLTLPTGPAAANAVRKDYVDAADATLQTNVNAKADKNYVDSADALKADKTYVDNADALKAPLASPTFTGDPRVPDAVPGDNDQTIANTKFVTAAVAAGVATVPAPPVAATTAEYLANSAPTKMLTPGAAWSAAAAVSLTDAASVGPNLSLGLDFIWALGAAGRTLANPTGGKPGQKGLIFLLGGAGSVTTWGSNWKFPGGVKPITSVSVDIISYVVGGDGTTIYCTFQTGFA